MRVSRSNFHHSFLWSRRGKRDTQQAGWEGGLKINLETYLLQRHHHTGHSEQPIRAQKEQIPTEKNVPHLAVQIHEAPLKVTGENLILAAGAVRRGTEEKSQEKGSKERQENRAGARKEAENQFRWSQEAAYHSGPGVTADLPNQQRLMPHGHCRPA